MAKNIETNVVKPEVNYKRDGFDYRLIDEEMENNLDNHINSISSYCKENNGKGKSTKEKDELYLNSQKLWKNYISDLESTKYNFYLNKDQWKFLTDLVLNKLELFDLMKSSKYKRDEYIAYSVNATEVTYIYHLISKYTVKGLTKDSYLFSEILILIGAISKLFNYYDATGKNIASNIQDWVVTFEDGVDFENRESEVIETQN
jgi:hypothetical protein